MALAIGIDLGTTNTAAAVVDRGQVRMLPLGKTTPLMPSVFAIDEASRRLVGFDAKRQAALNPFDTVIGAKRLIGRTIESPTIARVRQQFTYQVVEGDDAAAICKVRDELLTPEEISAAMLRRVKEVAEEDLQEIVEQVVITVPANFNDRQRDAVRKAGNLAGLDVLRLLNEPTAAAIGYGLGKGMNRKIAVYDLGGGTFDISIIEISDQVFEVIATGGDSFLGGMDFDERLVNLVLETANDRHGVDLSWHRSAMQRIREAAEVAKVELSGRMESHIFLPHMSGWHGGAFDLDMSVTRPQFELLCADLVNRTLSTCKRIFHESGVPKDEIHDLVLVGGQTRMPLVQRLVGDWIGRPPVKGVNPDEVVAVGAAILANALTVRSSENIMLLDVLPKDIGIARDDGVMTVVFKRNTPLPDLQSRTLGGVINADGEFELRVFQGENVRVVENELLGTVRVKGLARRAGTRLSLEFTFHLNTEGILTVSARDPVTGADLLCGFRAPQGAPE